MLFIAYLFISIHIYIYILLTKYSHCLADQTILSEKCQQTNKYFTERIIFSEKIPLYRGIIPRFPSNYATKPRAFYLQRLILLITASISRDLSCWLLATDPGFSSYYWSRVHRTLFSHVIKSTDSSTWILTGAIV